MTGCSTSRPIRTLVCLSLCMVPATSFVPLSSTPFHQPEGIVQRPRECRLPTVGATTEDVVNTNVNVEMDGASTTTAAQPAPDMVAFSSGYATVYEERLAVRLSETNVPDDLVGTLYVNGPAMFTAGSLKFVAGAAGRVVSAGIVADGEDPDRMVKHPYEGDGAVLAVTFGYASADGDGEDEKEERSENEKSEKEGNLAREVTMRYRYVRTNAFTRERKKGARMYKAMDNTRSSGDAALNGRPLPLVRHHLEPGVNKSRKNTANSSVTYFAGKLLALGDGGLPYKLDALGLSTEGKSQLGGVLGPEDHMGGRSCLDAERERSVWFSLAHNGKSTMVELVEFDKNFRPLLPRDDRRKFQIPGYALMSDFALTSRYGVFIQPPVDVDGFQYMFSKDPSKTLSFKPKGNSMLHLIPRNDDKVDDVRSYELDLDQGLPAEHGVQFVNAFEDKEEKTVVIDLLRPEAVTSGKATEWPWSQEYMAAPTALWRYTLSASTGKVTKQRISTNHVEFAVVDPRRSGRRHRSVYASLGGSQETNSSGGPQRSSPGQGIGRFDIDVAAESQPADVWWTGEAYQFCGAPIFSVRKNGNDNIDETNGYVLTVVYDGNAQTSELVVLDAAALSKGPVARIDLGMTVPHAHHGCFAGDDTASCGWSFDEIERRGKLFDKMESRGNMWNEVKSDFSGLGLRLDDFEEYFGEIL